MLLIPSQPYYTAPTTLRSFLLSVSWLNVKLKVEGSDNLEWGWWNFPGGSAAKTALPVQGARV